MDKPYFSHENAACYDTELTEIIIEFKAAGYGMYWILIECLYRNKGILTKSDVKKLAFNFHLEEEDLYNILNFKSSNPEENLFYEKDGNYGSNGVDKRLNLMQARSKQKSANASKGWAKAKQNKVKPKQKSTTVEQKNADAMQVHANKIKENKIKENKYITYSPESLKFANWFYNILPDQKKMTIRQVDKDDWAEAYDELTKEYNYSEGIIKNLCTFARNDDFWSNTFFSATQLLERKNGKGEMQIEKLRNSRDMPKKDVEPDYSKPPKYLQM